MNEVRQTGFGNLPVTFGNFRRKVPISHNTSAITVPLVSSLTEQLEESVWKCGDEVIDLFDDFLLIRAEHVMARMRNSDNVRSWHLCLEGFHLVLGDPQVPGL